MSQAPTHILLVEDDDIVAEFLTSLLEEVNTGFLIQRAADLATALQHLSESKPQIILLDLNLPDSDGLATLESIQAAKSHIPVIIMTGSSDEELARQALEHGAADCLFKGMIANKLIVQSINKALNR